MGVKYLPKKIHLISTLEDMINEERERLPSLRGIERKCLKTAVRMVDAALGKIDTNGITTTNSLFYAGAALVKGLIRVKKDRGAKKQKPWWERRLERQVKELNEDLGRVNALLEKKRITKKHSDDLQRKYKIRPKRLSTVREEIKQRIAGKVVKIKIYSNRISQFNQNEIFQNMQERFYQQVNNGSKEQTSEAPDESKTKEFWSEVWGKETEHYKHSE